MEDEVKHFTDVWFTEKELQYLLKLIKQDNSDNIDVIDLQAELEVMLKQFK